MPNKEVKEEADNGHSPEYVCLIVRRLSESLEQSREQAWDGEAEVTGGPSAYSTGPSQYYPIRITSSIIISVKNTNIRDVARFGL